MSEWFDFWCATDGHPAVEECQSQGHDLRRDDNLRRPRMLSDNLGYPAERGNEDWARIRDDWHRE